MPNLDRMYVASSPDFRATFLNGIIYLFLRVASHAHLRCPFPQNVVDKLSQIDPLNAGEWYVSRHSQLEEIVVSN